MLELAEHIIKMKKGKFDPSEYDDRYESALADLVKAKLEDKTIEEGKEPKREKVIDLMTALRESAGIKTKKPAAGTSVKSKRTAAT